MEMIRRWSISPGSGSGRKKTLSRAFLFLLMSIMANNTAMAQNASNAMSIDNILSYSIGAVFAIGLVVAVVFVMNRALRALHENGRAVEFDFPVFGRIAHNEKSIGIVIAIIVAVGIIYAVTFLN